MTPEPPPVHPAARRRPGLHFLVWHDLVPRTKQVWFDTTRAEFEGQLARLEKAGAAPVSLDRAHAWLTRGEQPPPSGAVVLCFDDNTVGIHRIAFPLLRRRRWPFVVSAHSAYVGVRTGKDHCTWETLREMAAGGATLVSQTVTHPPDLRALNDADLAREIAGSRAAFARNAGAAPFALTYPSGKWDRRVALAAARAGYGLALTEDHGAAETSPHGRGVRRWSTHKRFDQALAAVARSARSGR